MEKLINQLFQEILPSNKEKELPHTFPIQKTICKFNKNQLFKGHSGSIVYGMYEDKTSYIRIFNQYHDTHVYYNYNFDTDKSGMNVRIITEAPKYMQAFFEKISENGKYTICTPNPKSIYENHIDIFLDRTIDIEYRVFYDGFKTFGHFENIQLAKEARNRIKMFKSLIREYGKSDDFCNNVTMKDGDKIYLAQSLFS